MTWCVDCENDGADGKPCDHSKHLKREYRITVTEVSHGCVQGTSFGVFADNEDHALARALALHRSNVPVTACDILGEPDNSPFATPLG